MEICCFWTGDNVITPKRLENLEQLKSVSGCTVHLIQKNDVMNYILKDNPLHPAYEYLSETHKADYLRTYFMHFYGGAYSDIKSTSGSWVESYNNLINSNYWICGYMEYPNGVAYKPAADYWNELIGNGCYICKPRTPLTTEWYNTLVEFLDSKLDKLKEFPATFPQDQAELGNGYPIEWNEMLGRIFHKVCFKYKDKLLRTLPIPICHDYR
jgi:hypothetical protein